MGHGNKNLGNAEMVRKNLEAKVAEADALKAKTNESKEAETPKEAQEAKTETKKVKLTDILIAVVNAADYIPAELRTKLLEEINAKLVKTTFAKVTTKSTVYDMLVGAGADGITKDQMVDKFMTHEPRPTTAEMISFVTNLNWFVQPSFYKKEGWNVFVKEGGFYGVTVKK